MNTKEYRAVNGRKGVRRVTTDTEWALSLTSARFVYDEAITVESCAQSLCDLALRFGEGGEDEVRVLSMHPVAAECSCLANLTICPFPIGFSN